MHRPAIGLALGGGGARGMAHIGILEGLHARQIVPDEIAGTSAGAVVGAMYAASRDPGWIEAHFRTFLASRAFADLGTDRLSRRYDDPESISLFARRLRDHMVVNLSLHRRALISRDALRAAIEFLVPARTFEELLIPMQVCACEMATGQLIVHGSGDLIEALCDSSGIPGVIEPRIEGDRVIADGGMLAPVPVRLLASRFNIASDVSRRSLSDLNDINIYNLMMRAEHMTQLALARTLGEHADFLFRADVRQLHWSQFSQIDQLLAAGRREVERRGDALEAAIARSLPPVQRWVFAVRRWWNTRDRRPGAATDTAEPESDGRESTPPDHV